VTGFAGFLFSFFLMIAALYFFFVDGKSLVSLGKEMIPLRARHADALLSQFREVSVATLLGTLLTGLSQGATGALVFLVLGLPAPLFWGAVMGAAAFIPFVGAGLVWVPAAVYLFATGSAAKGISLFALGVLLISSVDNLVRTFVMRGRMRMHILVLFLSLIGGVKTFGLVGVILGPLIAALFQTFLTIYKSEFRTPTV
jgi:predicted PurR-regulated permease PerM